MKKDYSNLGKESKDKISQELKSIGKETISELKLYQEELDNQAEKYNFTVSVISELAVIGTMAGVNQIGLVVLGTAFFSNPIIAVASIGVGAFSLYKPNIKAKIQRYKFYREYETISDHIHHVEKVIDNKNNKSSK